MKLGDVDFADYNRVLASIGVVLITASVLLPWLLLRDSSILEISRNELRTLTPTAAEAVRSSQDRYRLFSDVAPWLSVGLFLAGVAVLSRGLYRIRALQPYHEAPLIAKGMRAQREINEQSVEEIESRATDELQSLLTDLIGDNVQAEAREEAEVFESPREAGAERAPEEGSEAGTPRPDSVPGAGRSPGSGRHEAGQSSTGQINAELFSRILSAESNRSQHEAVREILGMESLVLDQIALALPATRRLSRHPRISAGEEEFEPDAVISSPDFSNSDVIVDVVRTTSAKSASRRLDLARGQLSRYRQFVDSEAKSWQILVVPDVSTALGGSRSDEVTSLLWAPPERIELIMSELASIQARYRADGFEITVIPVSRIDSLRYPPHFD